MPALSDASFEQAYTEIARKLPGCKDTDEDPKESVQQYLSSAAAGPWLLIVDNPDDIDVLFGKSGGGGGINQYLPESEKCLVLFTTRSREVAVSVVGSDIIVVRDGRERGDKSPI